MVIRLVNLVFNLVILLVFARVIISWVPVNRYHPVVTWIEQVTEPMLRPFRVIVRAPGAGLDLAPMILLIVLYFLKMFVVGALAVGPRLP
jgi:YggT family protein